MSYETINNRNAELNKFLRSLIIPVTFVVLLWAIHFSQTIFNLPFAHYGILPRKLSGLVGILSAPLVHANYSHLISNTPTLLILSVAVMYFYPTLSLKEFQDTRSQFLGFRLFKHVLRIGEWPKDVAASK